MLNAGAILGKMLHFVHISVALCIFHMSACNYSVFFESTAIGRASLVLRLWELFAKVVEIPMHNIVKSRSIIMFTIVLSRSRSLWDMIDI